MSRRSPVVVFVALASCAHPTAPPPQTPPPVERTTVDASRDGGTAIDVEETRADAAVSLPDADTTLDAGPPAQLTASSQRLVVGDDHGVREIAMDGTVIRVITATPARMPRFVAHDRIVFIEPRSHAIRIVPRAGGVERTVFTLPDTLAAGCGFVPAAPYDPLALIRSEVHFETREDPNMVCVYLSGSDDEASLLFQIDLRTRAVGATLNVACGDGGAPARPRSMRGFTSTCEHAFDWGSSGGMDTETVASCPPGAAPAEMEDHPAGSFAFDVGDPGDAIVRALPDAGVTTVLTLPQGFTRASTSPSGRWRVLYAHVGSAVRAFILDRASGELRLLAAGAWGPSLDAAELSRIVSPPASDTSAGPSGPECWMPGEILVIGDLIVAPGQGAVAYQGQLGL